MSAKTERELTAVALALIGEGVRLTPAEQRLAMQNRRIPGRAMLAAIRAGIKRGNDPLGEALIALRSPALRREAGAIYTPKSIVDSMIAWVQSEATPARVVEPGAGSGRFLIAAGAKFPRAKLIGVELDPLAALILR